MSRIQKNIDNYIRVCVRDACKRNGRIYNSEDYKYAYNIVEGKLFVCIKHKYPRIQGNAFYRLQRNSERLFGLETVQEMSLCATM